MLQLRRVSTSLALLCLLATYGRSQDLTTLADLDAYVANKYESLSNDAFQVVMYPIGSPRIALDCGRVSFAESGELASPDQLLTGQGHIRCPGLPLVDH
jgi:hypothetical protein